MEDNLYKIKTEMLEFLAKFRILPTRDRQVLFLQCVMVFDCTFWNEQIADSEEERLYCSQILRYGYPVFIKLFYDKAFAEESGIPLCALNQTTLKICHEIIYACKTVGWVEFVEENVKYGNFVISQSGKSTKITFAKKYHWNEYIEQQYLSYFSEVMAFSKREEYDALNKDKERILQKMQDMVFVWHNEFMGYTNDIDVEEFFHAYAELDLEQDTNWDMFNSSDKFGGIDYENYVCSIMDFSGYAIKHYHFGYLLKKAKPHLITENLFYLCKDKENLIKLIAENRNISKEAAQSVFDCLTLSSHNISLYDKPMYCTAPFIQLSKELVIQSMAGTLHSPFGFLLENLSCSYLKDWSNNVGNREASFRKELYLLFEEDNYLCLDRPVNIISATYGKTDIDAVIIDKKSGEIALFQLKWQGPTYISTKAMHSKSKNYYDETRKWLMVINDWVENTSIQNISSLFGIPQKYIDKSKIHIFILGRHHANYSSNAVADESCVWGQWYQFLSSIQFVDATLPKISQFYNQLKIQSPYIAKYTERSTVFQIGEYEIVYGNEQES